jgi:hypothetical protein
MPKRISITKEFINNLNSKESEPANHHWLFGKQEKYSSTIIPPMKMACNRLLEHLGQDLSKIVNQDGDVKLDSQIVDEMVDYLKELKIYKPRK